MKRTLLLCLMISATTLTFSQKTGSFKTYTKIENSKETAEEGSSMVTADSNRTFCSQTAELNTPYGVWHVKIDYLNSKEDSLDFPTKMVFSCRELGVMNLYKGRFHDGPTIYESDSDMEETIIDGKKVKLKFFVMNFLYEGRDKVDGGWRMQIEMSEDGGENWSEWLDIVFKPEE